MGSNSLFGRTVRFLVLILLVLSLAAALSHMAPARSAASSQLRLEGLTLVPSVGMTEGALQGWQEDSWVPLRLTITNNGPETDVAVSVDLEYMNGDRIGIDAFASCFKIDSAPYCGSGSNPGSGTMWNLLVGSDEERPAVGFGAAGGVTTIRWDLGLLKVPTGTLEVKWAVHLAKSNSPNLLCSNSQSPLTGCSPSNVASGQGEGSWPGKSLQVRIHSPPGEKTIPIDVYAPGAQGQGPQCIIATAAYGSELAAPVQFLRQFRDNDVRSTSLGRAFMGAFENWYYSWAPPVAKVVGSDERIRFTTQILISPLIGSLYVSYEAFSVLEPVNPELAIESAGVLASSLIGLVYLTPVAFAASCIRPRRITAKTIIAVTLVGAGLTLFATLTTRTIETLEIITALIVVETVLLIPTLTGPSLSALRSHKVDGKQDERAT